MGIAILLLGAVGVLGALVIAKRRWQDRKLVGGHVRVPVAHVIALFCYGLLLLALGLSSAPVTLIGALAIALGVADHEWRGLEAQVAAVTGLSQRQAPSGVMANTRAARRYDARLTKRPRHHLGEAVERINSVEPDPAGFERL